MRDELSELKDIVKKVGRYVESLTEGGLIHLYGKQAGGEVIEPEKRDRPSGNDAAGILTRLEKTVSQCRKCGLSKTRSCTVFGTGSPQAALMLVGEAPGGEEDRTGQPFVGRAGQLLTKMLAYIGMKREEVYITNVLKCRPPGNRDPRPEEVACCEPYLLKQLDLVRPRLICALGRHAAQTLLKTEKSIGALRGHFHEYHGIKIIPTFHPAYLLRNPADKDKAKGDLSKIKAFLSGKPTISQPIPFE